MKRREIIKRLSILPLTGSFLPMESFLSASRGPLVPGANHLSVDWC